MISVVCKKSIITIHKNSCFILSLLSKIKQIWYYFLMKTNKCKPDVRLGINLLGNLGTKSFPSMHQSNILKMWIKFYYYSIFAKLELQPEGSHFLIKNTCKNSMRGELLWRFNDKVICSNWNYQKIVNFCYSSILHTTTYCLMPKKLYEKMLMVTIFGSKE